MYNNSPIKEHLIDSYNLIHRDCTVVICARNAGKPLYRAIQSIPEQVQVILVDDYSTDGSTYGIEKRFKNLRVERPLKRAGLGNARATALRSVETPWLIWLDADDEFLPARIQTLLSAAERRGLDLIFDSAELWDGVSGKKLRDLLVPEFMNSENAWPLLFMRNWLPGSAWPLVRTETAKRVGYDENLLAAEDLDFNLRAVSMGLRLGISKTVGYRQYAYSNSLSRNLLQQNEQVAKALRKVKEPELRKILLRSYGDSPASNIVYGNFMLRLGALEAAEFELNRANQALDGLPLESYFTVANKFSFPYSNYDIKFQVASMCTKLGRLSEASRRLLFLLEYIKRPEVHNNLGVCQRLMGREEDARREFRKALEIFPNYIDAQKNLLSPAELHLTLYPIRRYASRHEYL